MKRRPSFESKAQKRDRERTAQKKKIAAQKKAAGRAKRKKARRRTLIEEANK